MALAVSREHVKSHKDMVSTFNGWSIKDGNSRRRVLSVVGAILTAGTLVKPCLAQDVSKPLRLEVSARGTYTIDGEPVERAALFAKLLGRKRGTEPLLVNVVPQKDAKYEDVYAAMDAVQKVGARIGMVGNEAFHATPKSSGLQP